MKKTKKLAAVMITVLTMLPVTASAQDSRKPVQMEEVVVTASKIPKTPGNVTQQVDVLSQEFLNEQVVGKGNITELLTYQPGSAVSVLSRNDANWGAYGGIGPKYTTFMLDGLPIDSFTDPQSLDPWILDRIETQRGPASVLYPNYLSMDFAGNQSPLAGTTNLILKEKIDKSLTKMLAGYGSYDTYTVKALHQNHAGNIHYFFGGFHEQSDYTNYGTDGSWLNMIDDPEYEKTKLYVKATTFFGESESQKLSVFAHRSWHTGDAGRPNRDFDHEYTTLNGAYTGAWSDSVTAQIKLGFRDYDRTWEEDNYPKNLNLASENGVRQKIVPADMTISLDHLNGSLLNVGADMQTASYETFSEAEGVKSVGNDSDSYQYGIFVQEELNLSSVTLRLGGRYHYVKHDIDRLGGAQPGNSSQSWDKFLWSAGVKYSPISRLSLYSNVGTSFMAPGLKSVGGTLKLADRGVAGKDGQLPNPDLKPETGIGADIGANYQPIEGLTIGVRGFLNKIDDAIVENRVSEKPSQSQSVNAGKTTAYGAEIDIRHKLSPMVQWFANYTYTDTEISNDLDPDQDGADVPFVADHLANLGIMLNLPYEITADIYLHVSGRIYDSTSKQGRKKFDAYETLNLKLQKGLVSGKDYQVRLFANVYNLTDNEFEMPWQFQDPGISVSGGVEASF